jgi:RHH-type transcriptional regulator, rel operon repressor / antitoxin RelB
LFLLFSNAGLKNAIDRKVVCDTPVILPKLTFWQHCDTLNICIHCIHWEINAMPTSIRLPADIERRLDFLASQTGRTKAFYLRQIIEQGIDDMEDYYLAADVLERVRKGKEKIYSPEEVERDLGLAD